MSDHTEMNQDGQNKELVNNLEGLSQKEERWLFRPFEDNDDETTQERTALNKYEKLFLKALGRNPNVSWVDTAVMALAADLEEYTGETVYVGGPFASEVFLSYGNNHSIITAELTRSKMFLNYRAKDSNHDERIPSRNMTDTPLKSIGVLLGGKDHASISHGVKKIENDLKTDEALNNTVNIIKKKINPV